MEGKIELLTIRDIVTQLNKHIVQNSKAPAVCWEDDDGVIQVNTHQELLVRSADLSIGIRRWLESLVAIHTRKNRIGVWLPREADYVATFLSIWSINHVFVPISDTSIERLEQDSKLQADFLNRLAALMPELDGIITTTKFRAYLEKLPLSPELKTFIRCQTADIGQLDCCSASITAPSFSETVPTMPAYVYCSSGTSGIRKIIEISYEGIAYRFRSVRDMFDVKTGDGVLNFTGFDFDPSLMEMLLSFYSGGLLAMVPDTIRRGDISRLAEFYSKLKEKNLSLPAFAIFLPKILDLLEPEIFKNSLKGLMTTGEDLSPNKLLRWFTTIEGLKVLNGYGPTETTWGATLDEIQFIADRSAVYPPIINTPMLGIDLRLALVPEDNEVMREEEDISKRFPLLTLHQALQQEQNGNKRYEICISGNGLGKYIGLQSEHYNKTNWFTDSQQRYFRTWDGAEFRQGLLTFTGRIDRCFKYNGEWVSLKALEDKVKRCPEVQDAIAIRYNTSSLVCMFVLFHKDIKQISLEQMYSIFAKEKFAPRYFFQVDRIPLSSNHKTSYKLTDYAKCNPALMRFAQSMDSRYDNEIECLGRVWKKILIDNFKDEFTEVCKILYDQDKTQLQPPDNISFPISLNTTFNELGASSLHFMILINMLWVECIQKHVTSSKSRLSFREGILNPKLQSLENMSKFIELYKSTLLTTHKIVSPDVEAPCYIILIGQSQKLNYLSQFRNVYYFHCQHEEQYRDTVWRETWAKLIAAEIKELQQLKKYNIAFVGSDEPAAKLIFNQLQSFLPELEKFYFFENIPTSSIVQHMKDFQNSYERSLLTFSLRGDRLITEESYAIRDKAHEYINMLKDSSSLCLHGTSCGKTTILKTMHYLLHKTNKTVCYISCRQLINAADNLKQLLKLPERLYQLLESGDQEEIFWFIDDVEFAAQDSRLFFLLEAIKKFPGQHRLIFAARQWFDSLIPPQENIKMINYSKEFRLKDEKEINTWIQAERERLGIDPNTFRQQLKTAYSIVTGRNFTPKRSASCWWESASVETVFASRHSSPMYALQLPTFSSLSLFMQRLEYSDSLGYQFKFHSGYQERIKAVIDSIPAVLVSTPLASEHLVYHLPEWIKLLTPAIDHVSPWILFHPITGELPGYYYTLAERIYTITKQPVYAVCLPINDTFDKLETLVEQVKYYLDELEHLLLLQGEIHLLGWSYGGFLAFEAGRQLESRNRSVSAVINLDAAPILFAPSFKWETYLVSVIAIILDRDNRKDISRKFKQAVSSQQQISLDKIFSLATAYYESEKLDLKPLLGLTTNLKLLLNYCKIALNTKLKAPYFIFEAKKKIPAIENIVFSNWKRGGDNVELYSHDCDHFSLFEHEDFCNQLEMIISEFRENVDNRPLFERLIANQKLNSTKNLKQVDYIPVQFKTDSKTKDFQAFLNDEISEDNCLIIEGLSGTGKSRAVNELAFELIQSISKQHDYRTPLWIPIIINPQYIDQRDDLSKALRMAGFHPRDFASDSMNLPYRLLIIIDGLNELELKTNWDFENFRRKFPKSKFIMTTQPGYDPNQQLEALRLSFKNIIYWILPEFDQMQVEQWIDQAPKCLNLRIEKNQLGEILRQILENNSWVSRPLFLEMIAKSLGKITSLHVDYYNENIIYEIFFKQLTDEYLAASSRDERSSNQTALMKYMKSISLALCIRKKSVSTHSIWASSDSRTSILRKYARVKSDGTSLNFHHPSWRDYLFAVYIFEQIRIYPINPLIQKWGLPIILSSAHLSFNHSLRGVYTFLRQLWDDADLQTKITVQHKLFTVVLLSRIFENEETSKLARIALTFIGLFNISIADIDFRSIRAARTDITGLIAANADLSHADLSYSILSNIWLSGAILKETNLTKVDFLQLPKITAHAYIFLDEALFIRNKNKIRIFHKNDVRTQNKTFLIALDDPPNDSAQSSQLGQSSMQISNGVIVCTDIKGTNKQLYFISSNTNDAPYCISFREPFFTFLLHPYALQLAIRFADRISIYSIHERKFISHFEIESHIPEPTQSKLSPHVSFIYNVTHEYHMHHWSYKPDGKQLAAINKKTLYIWEPNTLKILLTITETGLLGSVCYHPVEDLLFVASLNQIIIIETNNWTKKIIDLENINYGVSLSFSANGALFAYPSRNCAMEYDWQKNVALNKFQADSSENVEMIKHHRSGQIIALMTLHFVYVFNRSNNQLQAKFHMPVLGHKQSSTFIDIQFHPRNNDLYALNSIYELYRWPLRQSYSIQHTLPTPTTYSFSLRPNQQQVVYISEKRLHFFDARSRMITLLIPLPRGMNKFLLRPERFHQESMQIVFYNKDSFEFFNPSALKTGTPSARHTVGPIARILYSAGAGDYLIITTRDSEYVHIYNSNLQSPLNKISLTPSITSQVLTTNEQIHIDLFGKIYVQSVFNGETLICRRSNGHYSLWDIKSGNSLNRWQSQTFSHDGPCTSKTSGGNIIGIVSNSSTITLIKQIATSFLIRQVNIPLRNYFNVDDIDFHPNSNQLAVAAGGRLFIYDLDLEQFVYQSEEARIFNLRYSPNGKYLACVINFQSICILDSESRKTLVKLSVRHAINTLEWLNPDPANASTHYIICHLRDNFLQMFKICSTPVGVLSGHLIWMSAYNNRLAFDQVDLTNLQGLSKQTEKLLRQVSRNASQHNTADLSPPISTQLVHSTSEPKTSNQPASKDSFHAHRTGQNSPLLSLSPDLLCIVLNFLPYHSFCALARVSKALAFLVNSPKTDFKLRPRITSVHWAQSKDMINEQLQIMGLFANKQNVNSATLRLRPIKNGLRRDCFHSVSLVDTNGTELADVNIWLLHDYIQRSPKK